MSYSLDQIETHLRPRSHNGESKRTGRYYKQERNRKIRRVKQDEIPNIKYDGWEY